MLAPHPDDETLGCGGTIARAVFGESKITIVIATDGQKGGRFPASFTATERAAVRRSEAIHAAQTLSLADTDLIFLNYGDSELAKEEDHLTATLKSLFREHDPEMVFTTAAVDPHPDHAALGRATRRALAGSSCHLFEYFIGGWVAPVDALRTWRTNRTAPLSPFSVKRPVRVHCSKFLSAKRSAIGCFRSQLTESSTELGFHPTELAGQDLSPSRPCLSPSFLKYFLQSSEDYSSLHAR